MGVIPKNTSVVSYRPTLHSIPLDGRTRTETGDERRIRFWDGFLNHNHFVLLHQLMVQVGW